MTKIADSILPIKIAELVKTIQDKKGLEMEQAFTYLYSSKFYSNLIDDRQKLWYMSTEYLYSLLDEEKLKNTIGGRKESKVILFCTFCIENYSKKRMRGDRVKTLETFSRYGVYSFLIRNFEVLHSQDEEYILDNIDDFINSRR